MSIPASAFAIDRTPPVMPGSPPGGVAIAWPLGIIVALVVLMFAVGSFVAHRHGRRGRGPSPR
jgi:hypothetical protein